MGRLIVEQIVSADGYASETDGGIGYFDVAGELGETEPEQVRMLQSVRAILFGRVTYAMFADYWPRADPQAERVAVPIRELPKYVVSNTLASAPWGDDDAAEVLRGDGVQATRALRARIDGDIIVWGSLGLCDALFAAGEVDVLRLRVVPMLIGEGRSFTPAGLGRRRLQLRHVDHYPRGNVVMAYDVARG